MPFEFWKAMANLKNPNNSPSFYDLSIFSLTLLSLPHSNAEPERIFSDVNNIKTDLRNKLKTNTVDSIIHSKQGFKNSKSNSSEWEPHPLMLKNYNREKEASFINEELY